MGLWPDTQGCEAVKFVFNLTGAPNLLIERDSSLKNLISLVELAASGKGSIVLVSGEAGIGKTSLLQKFRQNLGPQQQVKWGGCDPLYTPRVLGPIHDMRQAFGQPVRELLDKDPSYVRLFSAILSDIESGHAPAIFVIEDAHWADHATLDLLKYLGRRISLLKAVLIISYRHDEVGKNHPLTELMGDLPQKQTHRINLKPISPEGVQLLALASGKQVDGLHQITGGNPFFITELLETPRSIDLTVPESVQDAIGSRLKRLPKDERGFLETISVIPYAIDLSLLTQLFGDQGERLALSCVSKKLLKLDKSGAYRFRHELVRLGTKTRVLYPHQQKIHEQILAAFLSNNYKPNLDQIVYHASGTQSAEHVLKYAPLAASKASTSGAHKESASHLATALQYVDQAPKELAAKLYETWAYEAGLVQIDETVIDARLQALNLWRRLDRPDKIGENLRWLSRLHWYRGEADQANQFADEAVNVFESTEPSSERAMAYSLKSQLHMLNDRMDDAVHWGKKALEFEEQFPNIEVRVHAKNNIGTALLFRDDLDGHDYLQSSLSLALKYELHEHAARVYTNLAEYAVENRDFELAEKTIADGIAYDTNHDLDTWTHYLIGLLARLRAKQGRLEEAETVAEGVMKLDRLTLLMKLPALLVLSQSKMRLGKADAPALLAQALRDALNTGEIQYIVPCRLNLIEAAWLAGNSKDAIKQIEYLLAIKPSQMNKWRNGKLMVWMHRYGLMPNTKILDRIPEPFRFEINGEYEKAAESWLSLASPYLAALTLMQGTDKDIVARFLEALPLLEKIYAKGAINKISDVAHAMNIADQLPLSRRGPRKTSRQHPLGLTQKEQEILPLILDGLSNKEISIQLSRSQRTVENHISKIFKKLNVNSRMETMLRVKSEPWLVADSLNN